MAQQTAVEYLKEKLMYLDFHPNTLVDVLQWIEQAKQMEKEQIMKAVYDSMGTNFDPNWGRAELYYNETYNK